MLIVAIPKSASTSLMETLGRLHGIPATQTFLPDHPVPTELQVLHRYHSDIREMDEALLEGFDSSDRIFKQHLPPTEKNTTLLRRTRKVILLRNPGEIIGAYYRAQERKMHSPRPEFMGCRTLHEWQERALKIGLTGDLEWFCGEWAGTARTNPEQNLVLQYSDLIKNPRESVNRIETFFGLPPSPKVVLSRERYSRGPRYQALLREMGARARGLLRRFSDQEASAGGER